MVRAGGGQTDAQKRVNSNKKGTMDTKTKKQGCIYPNRKKMENATKQVFPREKKVKRNK